MKILLTPGLFCYGIQRRGESLHYLKNLLDPPCPPVPPPTPSPTNLLQKVCGHLDQKSLGFLPFQIIFNYSISLRSF